MKNQLRSERSNGVTRCYALSNLTELSPKQQILKVTENKKQLMQLIVEDLKTNFTFNYPEHTLIVTGIEPSQLPFQISEHGVTPINDLNKHEEAVVIIIHQLLHACSLQSRIDRC